MTDLSHKIIDLDGKVVVVTGGAGADRPEPS